MDLKSFLAAFLLILCLASCVQRSGQASGGARPGRGGPVALGIDVLEAQRFRLLAGKRVGLITNHTSYNSRGQLTRVVLQQAPEVNLRALYAPEHGIDGQVRAGDHIPTRVDPITGLMVHSLYGVTRKPSPAQLALIDIMVFDLQDIGVRSYTYISTMVKAMEACGERGIEFVVLDRPNPLGGRHIHGPPLDMKWQSFVGQIPVPYVHAMTTGELALMTNGRGWVTRRPALHVVKMRNWNRNMIWQDTGLRWRPTSPNIPKAESPYYYATTGMLGGLMPVDIGIGTENPFEYAAGLEVDPDEFTRTMNAYGFPGIRFEPYTSATRVGRNGSRIRADLRAGADPVAVDVACIFELHRRVPRGLLSRVSSSGLSLFNKVYGSDHLEKALRQGGNPRQLVDSWRPVNQRFARERQQYLLYP